MAKIGRPAKYENAKKLERAVNAYFDSVSYKKPVIISTPTGEVDEKGNVRYKTMMLREGEDHTGAPVTVTEYLEPPSVASLTLYLGISRDTWAKYGKKKAFRPVVEQARARIEAYLVGKLESRHAQGVIFNLKNNFGWKDRQEFGLDEDTRKAMSVEQFLRREAKRDGGKYEY